MKTANSEETQRTDLSISKGLSEGSSRVGNNDDRPLVSEHEICPHGFKRGTGYICTYCDFGMDHGIQINDQRPLVKSK